MKSEHSLERPSDVGQPIAIDDDVGRGIGSEHQLVDGDVRKARAWTMCTSSAFQPSNSESLRRSVGVVERLRERVAKPLAVRP